MYCLLQKLSIANYNDYFKVIPQIGKEVIEANPDLKWFQNTVLFNT